MLAGELTPLPVERVAVGEVRRCAQRRDFSGDLVPSQLELVGDVAEDDKSANAVPGWSLGPQRSGPFPHQRCVADHVFSKTLVDHFPDAGRVTNRLGTEGKAL